MATRLKMLMAGGAIVALAAAGCGGSDDSGGTVSAGGGGGGVGNANTSLSISEPKDGANVTAPVTLKFAAGVPIDKESTGKDHVHVTLDGKTDNYTVVRTTTHQITGLTPGRHTIGVTLQHADHSPVGPKAEVTVNVTGGDSGGSSPSPSQTGGYGGGYGY